MSASGNASDDVVGHAALVTWVNGDESEDVVLSHRVVIPTDGGQIYVQTRRPTDGAWLLERHAFTEQQIIRVLGRALASGGSSVTALGVLTPDQLDGAQ